MRFQFTEYDMIPQNAEMAKPTLFSTELDNPPWGEPCAHPLTSAAVWAMHFDHNANVLGTLTTICRNLIQQIARRA
jgi:hypothetical protein